MTGRSALAALGLATLALGAGVAGGAGSDLDRTFNGNGRITVDTGADEALYALALAPDGKIVAAGSSDENGNAIVFRTRANGTLDPSFDGDGVRTIDSGGYEYASAVATQRDGKVVVAGYTTVGNDAVVYRLNKNGSLDKSFDLDGALGIDAGGNEIAYAVAVQPDGKIVVAGRTSVGDNGAVWRLTPNGKFDPTFDADGLVTIDSGGSETLRALALQPDGRIVVAGYTSVNNDAVVYRLTRNGSLDKSFDLDGAVGIDSGGEESAYGVAVQPDGRIVVAGYSSVGQDAVVYRLKPGGSFDRSFDGDGAVGIDSGDYEYANAVALQPNGKILVAGYADTTESGVVYRLNRNGSLDGSFGDDGTRIVAVDRFGEATAVALQRDGRIVVGGWSYDADYDATVVRLTGDRPPLCAGRYATIVGTPHGERLTGTPGADVIAGLGGRDTIRGLAGNDVLCGGTGNDVLAGGSGNDRLIGGPGRDRIYGGPGRDRIYGGPGRDLVRQ